MKTTHKLLCIPFWLAVFMGALGCVITFVPGSECGWYVVVAALSFFGLLIPKIFYRGAAMLLLILSIIAAVYGYRRGMEYYDRAGMHHAATINQSTEQLVDGYMTELPFKSNRAECPVHDWAINIAGRPFGINQWGHCDCSIYIGTRIATINVPAAAVALAALILTLLFVLLWAQPFWGAAR